MFCREIINRIGTAAYSFPQKLSSTDQYVEEAYAKVPSNLTQRVLNKYVDDVEAFGYNC